MLADGGFARAGGQAVLEVSTRRCRTRLERTGLLAESLLFARLHLTPTATADELTPAPTLRERSEPVLRERSEPVLH